MRDHHINDVGFILLVHAGKENHSPECVEENHEESLGGAD